MNLKTAQQIATFDFEPVLTEADIPPIDTTTQKRYSAKILRWVHNGAKGNHEWAWFALGLECETAKDADAYVKRLYPNHTGRYKIIEICTTKSVVQS